MVIRRQMTRCGRCKRENLPPEAFPPMKNGIYQGTCKRCRVLAGHEADARRNADPERRALHLARKRIYDFKRRSKRKVSDVTG